MKLSDELNHDLPKPRIQPSTDEEGVSVDRLNSGIRDGSVYWSSIEQLSKTLPTDDSGVYNTTESDASTIQSGKKVLVRQDTFIDSPFIANLNSDRPGLSIRPAENT